MVRPLKGGRPPDDNEAEGEEEQPDVEENAKPQDIGCPSFREMLV